MGYLMINLVVLVGIWQEFKNMKIISDTGNYDLIIPYEEKVYNQWVKATMLMCKIPREIIQNKKTRVAIFEILKDWEEE